MSYKINTPKDNYVTYTLNGVDYEIGPTSSSSRGIIMKTEEEALARAIRLEDWRNKSASRKLGRVKKQRLIKLKETDYMTLSDYPSISDEMKAWRQSLRDIPQDYTTEEQYDLLLATDQDKNSPTYGHQTHAIWSKP